MTIQILLVLGLQIIYFTFFYIFGYQVTKIIKRRVCPVCFAAGSTWLTLILLNISGLLSINKFLIAILLSESVVGVSYLIDEFSLVHPAKIPDYIMKFGIISYGTFTVMIFAFISELLGFLLFVPIIIFGFYALTPSSTNQLK